MIDLTSSTTDPIRTEITDHRATATAATIDLTDAPLTGPKTSLKSQVVNEVAGAQVDGKHYSIDGSAKCSGVGEMNGRKEDHLKEEENSELLQLQLEGEDRAENGNHNPVISVSNGNTIESRYGTHEHTGYDHMNGDNVLIKSECVDMIREDDRKGVEDGGQSAVLKNEASTIMECDPGSDNLDPVSDLILLPSVKREGDRSKMEQVINGSSATQLKESVASSDLEKTETPTVMTSTSNPIATTGSSSSSSSSASASSSSTSSSAGPGGGTGSGNRVGSGAGEWNGDGSIASKSNSEAFRRAEAKRKTTEAAMESTKMHNRQRAFLTEGLTPEGEEMDISTLSRIASMAAVYLYLTGYLQFILHTIA